METSAALVRVDRAPAKATARVCRMTQAPEQPGDALAGIGEGRITLRVGWRRGRW